MIPNSMRWFCTETERGIEKPVYARARIIFGGAGEIRSEHVFACTNGGSR